MVGNIFGSIFCIILYWQTCSMFTTYSHKCLSSKFYITVPNQRIYKIFAGGFRGRQKVEAEDQNKFSIIGIITYMLLLPWIIVIVYFIWNPPEDHERFFWLSYFGAVIMIDILDDCIGNVIYRIKRRK